MCIVSLPTYSLLSILQDSNVVRWGCAGPEEGIHGVAVQASERGALGGAAGPPGAEVLPADSGQQQDGGVRLGPGQQPPAAAA